MRRLVGRVTKYDCDRCGVEFAQSTVGEKTDPNDASVKLGATVFLPSVDDEEVSFQSRDLCGGCVTSLSDWMKKK